MACDVYQPRYQDGCDQCGRPSREHPRVFVPTDQSFGPPSSRPNPEYHEIRLVPTDRVKSRPKDDEWRSECSCGWVGPPDAGQGPAAEHWLRHMQELGD